MSSNTPTPIIKFAGGTSSPGFPDRRIVIVVGPSPDCAQSVAESFATQGEPMRVVWFEQAGQALEAGPKNSLAGVVFCHHTKRIPNSELNALRKALPDTPVLPWALPHAA